MRAIKKARKRRSAVQRCQDELLAAYGKWLDDQIWNAFRRKT